MLISSKTFSKILFLTLTAFFSITAFAQANSGGVEGTITDKTGAVVPGATVSIESKDSLTGFKESVTTNENGYFVFAQVPPGMYKVTVNCKGFVVLSGDIEVIVGKSANFNPILEPALISYNFIFGGTQLSTDTVSNTQTTLIKESYEEILLKTTFSSLLKIVPFVRPEILSGGFQINGASGSENAFFIDGLEVTNFRTGQLNSNNDLPFEILQEVQVNSEMTAQYGSTLGGNINIVTRGGADDWIGNFGVSFTPNSLQGSPNVMINRFGTNSGQIEFFQPAKDGGTGFFPTASLGGPIVKGKLWFLASYSPQIYRTTRTIDYFTNANPANRTISETIRYESNLRTEAAFVRLDAQPTAKIRMFGTFLYNPIIQDGALPSVSEGLAGVPQSALGLRGAALLAERGGRQNSNLVNGQITWNPTNYSVINVRAGRTFLNEKLDSYGIPRITRFICSTTNAGIPAGAGCTAGFQNISNNSVRDYDVSDRTTFDADAELIGIYAFGRHNFKFGYQYNRLFNEIKEGYTDTGIVQLFYGIPITNLGIPITPTAGNLGSGFLQRFGTVGEASNTNQAIYAQDSWQINNRLTLNFGVRFENEDIPDYGQNLNLKFGWADKIAPRIGFVLVVSDDARSKIFANYGWYYDRLKYEMSRSVFPQVFYRDFFEILPSRGASYTNYTFGNILGNNVDNPNGNCPIVGGSGWSVCQFSFTIPSQIGIPIFVPPPIDPNLKPQRTSSFIIGFERVFGANLRLTASFIHRQLDRAIEDAGVFNSQGSEAYIVGNPGFGLICEIGENTNLPCPKAERKYDAFEVILDKRTSDYFFNASYTFSRLYGNYSGLASSDEFGRTAPNVTKYFDLPSYGFDADGNPDNGRLTTDRPHVFKAFGGYSFDWNGSLVNRTTISAFTTFQSGTPLTTIYNLYSAQTSILFGRGDLGRTEMFSETDLLVSHRYKFGKDNKFSIEPFVVFLNLFNERNELSRQTTISATNFTSTTLTQGGCNTCTSQAAVYYTIFNQGGIRQYIQNFLNSRGISATGVRNDYNQPNLFQSPRYFRFGMRFTF